MSQYNEPWRIEWIDNEGVRIVAANEIDVLLLPAWILNATDAVMLDSNDAARIVACVNACRGIPTHVLENWQGTDTEGLKPEDWLLNTVTEDGSGYVLASPAGGVMRLTSEQRERIGKALLLLMCPKCGGLSWEVPLSDYCKCVTHTGGLADLIPSLNNVQKRPTEPAEKV
jgi:hypothetical protein